MMKTYGEIYTREIKKFRHKNVLLVYVSLSIVLGQNAQLIVNFSSNRPNGLHKNFCFLWDFDREH